MSGDTCQCGATLGRGAQPGLPGVDVPVLCPDCQTKERIKHLLAMLPVEGERGFEILPDFEKGFLPSVRAYFAQHGGLSPKQIAVLERIYRERP